MANSHPLILIFTNPIAGRGQGASIARRLERRFRSEGHQVRVFDQHPDLLGPHDVDLSAYAAIAIGGDGTLRGVAETLYSRTDSAAVPSDTIAPLPPILVVPLGTANLMGRFLGVDWDDARLEEQVSAALRRRQILPLDAARANGRLFLLMAGVGFDAHVVHELHRLRRGPIRFASYLLPAASALAGYQYPPLRVTVDGREVFPPAPALAFVGNVAEYGTGFPVLPHARPDDGALDVCVLPCGSRGDMLRMFLAAAAGEHLKSEGVVYTKGRSVRIECVPAGTDPAGPAPVQVDGEAAGHTPLEVDLLPVRLPFIVP